jgi:hypothetical protein
MKGKAATGLMVLLALVASSVSAAPGAVTGGPIEAVDPEPAVNGEAASGSSLSAYDVWNVVGVQLVKQHVLLAMLDLRVEFVRDASGRWFLHLDNFRTGCHASRDVGAFDVMTDDRARALAFEVTSLIRSSQCGFLSTSPAASVPARPALAPWVRPAGGVYAATSGLLLWGISTSSAPNLSLSFAHAPSAFMSSGLMLGMAGGGATLFVPPRAARPLLELTVASSTALQALALARLPERGIPAIGEYAVASGYSLTSALIAVDWAASPSASTLEAPRGATERDVPRRAISPYIVYAPALIGAAVSLSRALAPGMARDDRELTLGLGTYALVPAAVGLAVGVVSSSRATENELPEPWIAAGPRGSFGLTLGGSL